MGDVVSVPTTSAVYWQMNECGRSPLWTLTFEFQIVFTCPGIILLLIFFQSFKNIKNILSSCAVQKWAEGWLRPMDHSLLNPIIINLILDFLLSLLRSTF